MSGYTTRDRLEYWLLRDRTPVMKSLIIVNVLTYLAIALFRLDVIQQLLAFGTDRLISMPWTAFTYPLIGTGDVIGMFFAIYWLWWAGGSLERSWGSRTFGTYFFVMSAASAIGLLAGSFLTGIPVSLVGLWLPIAGVTVAFAMLNPEQQILFFFVLPLKLKLLALLDVAIVLISYGRMHPLLGLLALTGCAISYWYAVGGRSVSLPSRRSAEIIRINPPHAVRRTWSPAQWYRNYRERKRLKNMLGKYDFRE